MTIHHVALDGVRLAYLDDGPADGRAIVLQHGFPDSPRSFDGLTHRLTTAGFRVIRAWLPGYPPSEVPARPLTPAAIAGWLEELAIRLDLREPALIGHDWGAIAGWESVEHTEGPWSCFVAMSVPPLGVIGRGLHRHPAQLWLSTYALLLGAPGGFRLAPKLVEPLWRRWSPSLRPPAGHILEVERMLRRPGAARSAASLYRWLVGSLRTPWRLPDGPGVVPVVYLHGAEDGCVSVRWAKMASEHLLAGRVRIVDGAGHFLHLEREGEVAGLIRDHLDATSTSAG